MRKDGRSADGGNVTAARRQGRERDRSIDFLTIDDTKTQNGCDKNLFEENVDGGNVTAARRQGSQVLAF